MCSGALAVLFLVFNEVYLTTGPHTVPLRHDLTAEAIRLDGNQTGEHQGERRCGEPELALVDLVKGRGGRV
jgi:predicted RNA polymerase sigma factor